MLRMNLTQCEQQLQTIYDQNPILGENISKITNTAWGKDKAYCLQRMGGVSNIKNFLFKKASYVQPKDDIETVSQTSQQTTTQTGASFWENT